MRALRVVIGSAWGAGVRSHQRNDRQHGGSLVAVARARQREEQRRQIGGACTPTYLGSQVLFGAGASYGVRLVQLTKFFPSLVTAGKNS